MSEFALKTSLPAYLREWQDKIQGFAKNEGLDFFPMVFEILTYDQMNEIAAYGGFPNRFPHWRYGMEYERLSKSYEYGLSKIYEMVINNNPSYAYLLEGNSLVDQKLVMAHVCGHVDFFKNNYCFRSTDLDTGGKTLDPAVRREGYDPNRKWIDKMANHGSRIRRHVARHGINKVEDFIDQCLSLENLVDPHAAFSGKRAEPTGEDEQPAEVPRLRAKEYMESFINPDEYIEEQKAKIEAEKERAKKFPERPERDILRFLLDHAPLERWERDVLEVIREEALYFIPQMQTKIMNEGWACVTADTLVFSGDGLISMQEVVEGHALSVSDGETLRHVYDRNIIRNHPTVRMRTARGLTVEGSITHRVLMEDGTWKRLDALAIGDRVRLSGGGGLFPERDVKSKSTDTDVRAVPLEVRRSSKRRIAEYLQLVFDVQARTTEDRLTLPVDDEKVAAAIQLLLMQFGVLSTKTDTHLEIRGASIKRFADAIGSDDVDGKRALLACAESASKERDVWSDEVVALAPGTADVYDISVRETHRYAAAGFIHHNSYWHSRLMTEKILDASEIIDYAENAAGVLATNGKSLNPYKLGIELFRNIEERWDKGQFGKEWEDCDDLSAKRNWNLRLGLGKKKIFEVRALYNDVTFIDEFLTPEFIGEQKLFSFGWSNRNERYEIETREFKAVKEKLLFQLTNAGNPIIYVDDANFENRGELLLRHDHQGVDLRTDYAKEVLKALFRVWKRPVGIVTAVDQKQVILRFDGREHSSKSLK